MNPDRRKILNILAAGGALAAAAPYLIRNALAMGNRIHTQGMIRVEGKVMLNGKPAQVGNIVKPGDTIVTGDKSIAVFVLNQDACLLRGNSSLRLGPAQARLETEQGVIETPGILTLLAGKMLAVYGKGEKKVILPTATLGIRGTAIYAEADPVRSYLCTCYGTVEIQSNRNPQVTETVVTRRHDMPRYINAAGKNLIEKAPVINHTEDELYMLEEMVGRLPEFHQPGGYQGANPY